jgi:hypothetical protein
MIDADRAERACRDVLAVELFAPGMARVITLGGCYTVDARGEGCQCPDKEYHLEAGEQCKHHAAAFLATSDDHPTPFLVREDLSTRTDPEFELERPPRIGRNHTFGAFTDGGECEACAALPEGVPCADCYITGRKSWSGTDSTAADTDTEA